MTNNLKQIATRSVGRSALVLKKYSPEILTGVGIATGVAAGVMAVRATLKVEPVVEKAKGGIKHVKELKEVDGYENDQAYAKDLAYVYTTSAIDFGKLYGPSVSLGAASIACIIGAHGIMKKRNAALVVAFNALEKTFVEYRGRVAEEFGDEKEQELRLGIRTEEVVDEETGKKKRVSHIDPNGVSQYAKFFDEYSTQWSKQPEYNLLFLRAQQQYANDKLQAYGHLFLNDVYEALGLPHTKAGALCGWIIGSESDNFVDFGIYDIDSDKAREFVNGYERSILLDFNVDGTIYDKI